MVSRSRLSSHSSDLVFNKLIFFALSGYAVLLLLITTQPTYSRIERSIIIDAPPQQVRGHLGGATRGGPWAFHDTTVGSEGSIAAFHDGGHCTTVTLEDAGGGRTRLTWSRSSNHGLSKILTAFMGKDAALGRAFEEGMRDMPFRAEGETS